MLKKDGIRTQLRLSGCLRIGCYICGLMLLMGCNPSNKSVQELQTLTSWSGSIRMIGEELLAQHITPTYAATALKLAAQSLQKEQSSLEKAKVPIEMIQEAKNLQSTAANMKIAVEHTDTFHIKKAIHDSIESQEKLKKMLATVNPEP
jgi:mannitol/fructose-specific phosphotransferase system IIA component (Ntr-type)